MNGLSSSASRVSDGKRPGGGRRQSEQHTEKERVARSIFGDVPLTDSERRLLAAAAVGHLSELKRCAQENGQVNLNCRDYLGRTPLQLTLQGEHYEALGYLLDRCSLGVVEEGLLHAIKSENVRICDMFLCHPIYSDRRVRMRLEFQHGFYDQEENNSNFAPDITPIVLAAQCNNFDIVHMLIQKGFTIPKPHNYFCYCTECSNHKTFDRFVHSRSRLNAYMGLASTAYLSLSSDDPIHMAFVLSQQLQNLADKEKEYKNEYKTLCENCKNYAVELLDLCRSNEEVMAALHGSSNTSDLSRIKMAIKYEQKRFVAHASSQEHLMSIWYAGVPWFQHQSFLVKMFLIPLGIMFIPFTAIVYVFLPYSRIGEVLRSPFMKFMNYICSYTAFLGLLLIATTTAEFIQSELFENSQGVVKGFIIFYVLGMFWAECKQLWEEGINEYFAQMWNYMDIMMLALYTASYTIEGVMYTRLRNSDGQESLQSSNNFLASPFILAKVLFSVANVLSFARIAYILPASESFGQLQISYGRMLQDVFKFICIYFTVMIAFICGLTSLYSGSRNVNFSNGYLGAEPGVPLSHYQGEEFSRLIATFITLFWAAFGMGDSKAPNTSDSDRISLVEIVGSILYGVYIIGAVVVLINMLIAMMSSTFEEIRDDEDVEWKFARAKLWISFIDESGTLPIPFNIIPTPKSILRLMVFCKSFLYHLITGKKQENKSDNSTEDFDYKAIMHKVVLRYIHKMKFDKKGDAIRDEIFEVKEEIVSHINATYYKLVSKMEKLEKDIKMLESGLLTGDFLGGAYQRRSPVREPSAGAAERDKLEQQQQHHQRQVRKQEDARRRVGETPPRILSRQARGGGCQFPSRQESRDDCACARRGVCSTPLRRKNFSNEV